MSAPTPYPQNQPYPAPTPAGYAYPPQPQPVYLVTTPRPPFSGFAIAGFVTSMLTLGLLGIVLSIVGVWQVRDGSRRGTGLAIFGILVGLAWAPLNVATIGAGWTFLTGGS